MKLGLLADIHEDSDRLARAIALLRAEHVDRFVMLGDIFELGRNLDATVALLTSVDSVGVWGNHDFGLCSGVSDAVRGRYSSAVIDYFATLRPAIEIDGCWFQHVEPFLDSESLEDLWYYGGEGRLDGPRSFASRTNSRMFMGHVHRWDVVTPAGSIAWKPPSPLRLDRTERYLIAIHAVVNGWCATFDTVADLLTPIPINS